MRFVYPSKPHRGLLTAQSFNNSSTYTAILQTEQKAFFDKIYNKFDAFLTSVLTANQLHVDNNSTNRKKTFFDKIFIKNGTHF